MKKITRESLKKAEKGSGVYTMGSVYKLPDTWTPTFDLSNHEKVSARNDYAEKPLKKVEVISLAVIYTTLLFLTLKAS